ncbi:unnamed protein product [Durusdinium trenchii]|uniref:FAD-binding domain-containing protein n=1 Tax=Durusdinium trenchii TaxID=1381693 RepID=A0ABP0KJR0_9DINO
MSVDPRPLLGQIPGEAPLDCLVVGAGPVGLLLASELAYRGCKVAIIDALQQPVKQTKASGVVPRSLEVLPAEVERKLLHNGTMLKAMQILEKKEGEPMKTVLDIKTSSLEVYGGILAIRQMDTESYLTEYLRDLPDWFRAGSKNLEIQRGVSLESFTEGPTGVQCVLKLPSGGIETVNSKFLVGCDGGHSKIRKQLGFAFEGTTTAEYFFGLDAAFENFELNAENVASVCLTQDQDPLAPGFAFNIPFGDGNCLLLVDIDLEQQKEWITGEVDRNGFPVLRQPEVEDVLKVAKSRGLGANLSVKPGSVRWLTHFRINSRQAECYGRGRVFLAGDACHCHSPLGGQGMNMGFQDAKNLAWKLVLAIKCGGPTTSLLQSYESERKTMESKLLSGIERAQEVVSSRNPVVFFLRGRGQRLVNILTFLQPSALALIGQQAWSYRKSSISMEHWERPIPTCFPITSICPAGGYRRRQNLHRWLATRIHAGDRVPDVLLVGGRHLHQVLKKSRGFTLLLFEGSAPENEDMEKHLKNKMLSFKELQALSVSMKCQADKTNFVAMIDEVVLFPQGDVEARRVDARGCRTSHAAPRRERLYDLLVPDVGASLCAMWLVLNSRSTSWNLVERVIFPAPKPSYSLDSFPRELILVPREDGLQVPCLFLPFRHARFLFIYFHANAEDLGLSYSFCKILRDLFQVHVMAVEYPGYGVCPGTCDEEGVMANASAAMRFVLETLRWPKDGIKLFGRSLGTAPTIQLATRVEVGGVILVSPFTSIKELFRHQLGRLADLLSDRFKNLDSTPKITSPTLIIHGQQDALVPLEHGRLIYASITCKRMFVTPHNMSHNTSLLKDAATFILPMTHFFSLPDYTFEDLELPEWVYPSPGTCLEAASKESSFFSAARHCARPCRHAKTSWEDTVVEPISHLKAMPMRPEARSAFGQKLQSDLEDEPTITLPLGTGTVPAVSSLDIDAAPEIPEELKPEVPKRSKGSTKTQL